MNNQEQFFTKNICSTALTCNTGKQDKSRRKLWLEVMGDKRKSNQNFFAAEETVEEMCLFHLGSS